MTVVPTASIPSGLDRFDSKYMTRVMQSRSESMLAAQPASQGTIGRDQQLRREHEGTRHRNALGCGQH